jgi:inosose dehydratase
LGIHPNGLDSKKKERFMNVIIGTAPDSWGVWFPDDPRQTPWERYLDEIVEAGYEWTELGPYGYLPTDIDVLRGELDKRGIKVSGTFAFERLWDPAAWPELKRQVVGAGEVLAELGGQYLVLIDFPYTDLFSGEKIAPRELDKDQWKRLIDTTHTVADLSQQYGLKVVVHPHADTHLEYEHEIEKLLEDTDANRVGLCLDTGHHAYSGGDPIEFMQTHHARIPYLHIKSVDGEVMKQVEGTDTPFAKSVGMDMFCEPSRGLVDFAAFRDVLEEVNYDGFAMVEQDMFPAPFDKPLPIAKRTRQYLRDVGIG